jgi:DNA transformation protein
LLRREFDSRQVHQIYMATEQSFIDYVLDQLSSLRDVFARKMFGEYALYYDGKVVALVCDNTVYVKITEAGKKFAQGRYAEGCAYPGAKASMQISDEDLEEVDWFAELITVTAEALPIPKPKKNKRST